MGLSIFGMMNQSTSGLMLSQAGMSVTTQNINNANTANYTRQRLLQTPSASIYYKGTGYLGTGVSAQNVQRLRDQHMEAKIQGEISSMNQYGSASEIWGNLEAIFEETDTNGFSATMKEFWNGWSELSKDSTSVTYKNAILETSKDIASTLNRFNERLSSEVDDIDSKLSTHLKQLDGLLRDLELVNESLQKAYDIDPTKTANDLLDTRDALVREISIYIPIEPTYADSGVVELQTTLSDGTVSDVLAQDLTQLTAMSDQFNGGVFKGLVDMKNEIQTNIQVHLNQYTQTFAEAVNDIQGFDFFTFDAANPTGSLAVNPELLNHNLDINVSGGADGNQAILDMLALRDQTFTIDGETVTFSQSFNSLVGEIGANVQKSETALTQAEAMYEYLSAKIESQSGVNLNEETLNLVQYQKAYEANAKVIATLTEMLDTIINQLGA